MRYQSAIKFNEEETRLIPIERIREILVPDLLGAIRLDHEGFTEDMLDPDHLAFYMNIDEETGNIIYYLVYVMEDIIYDFTTKDTIYGQRRKYRGGFIS